MKTDGTPNSESPAPDGEEYYAMALYFASARWGDGSGIYGYRAAADRILTDMKNRGVITGPWASRSDRIETDGAQFNLEHKMVRFTPDNKRADHTDPSYHLPAFYELWAGGARWPTGRSGRRRPRVSRDFLQKVTHPATGLAPEYANYDGTPVTGSRNQRSSTFGPDAWRTAANWSVDWSWWEADPRARALSDRIQAFFESKGLDTYGNRWTLDGATELESNHSPALVATNAIASLAATHPRAARFVEALWNTDIPSGQYRYYDGLWYLMGLLHCSGEFRIWTPAWAAAQPATTLRLNELEYLEMPGLNVMLAHDYYPEGHQGGVGIIQNGLRVATNGDIRLDRTPGQWQPVPKVGKRVVDRATQRDLPARRVPGRIEEPQGIQSRRVSGPPPLLQRARPARGRGLPHHRRSRRAAAGRVGGPRRVQHGALPRRPLREDVRRPRRSRACSRGSRTGRARSTGAASTSPSRWPPAAASSSRPSPTGSGWSSRTRPEAASNWSTAAGSTPTAGSWSARGSPAARRRAP